MQLFRRGTEPVPPAASSTGGTSSGTTSTGAAVHTGTTSTGAEVRSERSGAPGPGSFSPPDRAAAVPPGGGVRVLVVDDDAQVGARVRELLTDFGHDVVGLASSSLQALVLVKALHPDVVVTDLRMPGMSGIQLTAEVRRLPRPPAVVMVSAYDDASLQGEAHRVGAHAYVRKGAPGEQVHEAVLAAAFAAEPGSAGQALP